jgi:ATP synthase F0 subunit c
MNNTQLNSLILKTTSELVMNQAKLNSTLDGYKYLAVAVILSVSIITVGFGISTLISQYYKSVARQPEIKEFLGKDVLVFTGMVDAFAMIGVAICLLILFQKPTEISMQEIGTVAYSLIQKTDEKSTTADGKPAPAELSKTKK